MCGKSSETHTSGGGLRIHSWRELRRRRRRNAAGEVFPRVFEPVVYHFRYVIRITRIIYYYYYYYQSECRDTPRVQALTEPDFEIQAHIVGII